MKIEILSLNDKGYLFKENICIKVINDCNLSEYKVHIKNTADDEAAYTSKKNYTFESVKVKKGDIIYLHTDEGKNTKKVNKTAASEFNFYWGLRDAVWGSKSNAPALSKVEI